MTEKLEKRLSELKEQQEKGKEAINKLFQQQRDLEVQLLRIEGAIIVVEELIKKESQ